MDSKPPTARIVLSLNIPVIYIHATAGMDVSMYVDWWMDLCMYVSISMYVCMYVCMYVTHCALFEHSCYIYIYIYIYIFIIIYIADIYL